MSKLHVVPAKPTADDLLKHAQAASSEVYTTEAAESLTKSLAEREAQDPADGKEKLEKLKRIAAAAKKVVKE